MAGLIPLGRIAGPGEDVFPTTAPHLDVRVIPQFGPQKGKYIDPQTSRSLLQNVLVGENRTPLVQQQGDQWKWNYEITSPFGQRVAPVPGASTDHRGIDLGISKPETISYKGAGSYTPGKGYGTLRTTDAQGNPYDIKFLHIKPGEASSVSPQTQTEAPKAQNLLAEGLKKQVAVGLLSQALNPMSNTFLSEYASNNPFLSGRSAATSDFLGGVFG